MDYSNHFEKLQKHCEFENCTNMFKSITPDELIELNDLLDGVILFCENTDMEELELDMEAGDKVVKLYHLINELSDRDKN